MIAQIISLISSTLASSGRHNLLFNVLVVARPGYILTAIIIHVDILIIMYRQQVIRDVPCWMLGSCIHIIGWVIFDPLN